MFLLAAPTFNCGWDTLVRKLFDNFGHAENIIHTPKSNPGEDSRTRGECRVLG